MPALLCLISTPNSFILLTFSSCLLTFFYRSCYSESKHLPCMYPTMFPSFSLEKRLKILVTTCPWSHFGWKTQMVTTQLFLQYCSVQCKSRILWQEAPKSETWNPAVKYLCFAANTHEEWRLIYRETQDSTPSWRSSLCFFQGRKQNKKPVHSKAMQLSNPCNSPETAHKHQCLCWSECAQQQLKTNKILVRFRAAAVVFLRGQQWSSRVAPIWWCDLRKLCMTKHCLHALC